MASELASLEDLLAVRLGLCTLSEPYVPPMSQAVATAALKAWNTDVWRDPTPPANAVNTGNATNDSGLLDWQAYQYASLLYEDLSNSSRGPQNGQAQQDSFVTDSQLEALQRQLNVLRLQQQQQQQQPKHTQMQQQLQQQHELQLQSQAINPAHRHGMWRSAPLHGSADEEPPIPQKDPFQLQREVNVATWNAQHANLPQVNANYQAALSIMRQTPVQGHPSLVNHRQSWDRERFQRHVQRASGRGSRGQYRNPRRSASHIIPRAPTWAEPNWHPMAVVVQSGQLANGGTGVFLPGMEDDKQDPSRAGAQCSVPEEQETDRTDAVDKSGATSGAS